MRPRSKIGRLGAVNKPLTEPNGRQLPASRLTDYLRDRGPWNKRTEDFGSWWQMTIRYSAPVW